MSLKIVRPKGNRSNKNQTSEKKIKTPQKIDHLRMPASQNLRAATVNDGYRGTLNKRLQYRLDPMTPVQKAIAMSILNPGHQDNSPNAVGICSNGTGRVFISKCLMEYTVSLQEDCDEIVFYNLPFPEYPFGFSLLVYEQMGGWVQKFFAVPNRTFLQKDMNNKMFVESYLRNMGVYSVLPIGVSQTIECVQSKMYQKGRAATCRKAADIDMNFPSLNTDELSTSGTNTFVIQDLPTTMSDCSGLLGTYDQRDISAGAYIVSHHNSYTPIKRKYPWEKTPKLTVRSVPNDHRNEVWVKPLNSGTATRLIIYDPTEDGLAGTSPALVTNAMDVDMPMACFSALSASKEGSTAFSIKAACTLQFELKASSPLLSYTVTRPVFDPAFLDYILEFETSMNEGGYPADYNFWNKIWPIFKQLWQSGGGNLVGKIPKIGSTAKQIGDLITSQF